MAASQYNRQHNNKRALVKRFDVRIRKQASGWRVPLPTGPCTNAQYMAAQRKPSRPASDPFASAARHCNKELAQQTWAKLTRCFAR